MPTSKHKRSTRREVQSRYATITDWNPSLTVLTRKQRGLPPEREVLHRIKFIGTLEEPLKGVTDLVGTIYPASDVSTGKAAEPCIGSIISMRPAILLAVTFTFDEFSWLLTLAAGNQLAACHFACNEPVRGYAPVFSLSFDKALPPEDER